MSELPTRDVLALANEVHRWLADHGYSDAGGVIRDAAARWRDDTATVVVAGDIKRGKSSLLNALLRRPGLLPVDADVATGVHLVVRNGPEETASVTLLADESAATTTEPVDLGELGRYASMSGDEALRSRVVSVEVTLPHPLLAGGVALVDTPGVGGLAPGHREATMSALSRADALVFTIAVDTPVSRSELDFLAEAAARIERVVVCVTKADLATADEAATMMAEDRERLAERARVSAGDDGDPRRAESLERLRRAPLMPVSSYIAERALRREVAGRADAAADLWARSGLDDLTAWLEQAAAARVEIRLANLLHMLAGILDDVAGAEAARERAASGDPEAATELAQQQQRMEAVVSAQARWRGTLAAAVTRMQTEIGRAVTARLNHVRNGYRQALESAKGAELDALDATLPQDLERALHAAWCDLALVAEQAFATTIAAVAADLEIDTGGDSAVLGDLAAQRDFGALVASTRTDRDLGGFTLAEDGIPLAMQTISLAAAANAAGALLGVATGGLGFVAYGVGAAVSWPLVVLRRRHRKRTQTAAEWNRVVNETLFGSEGVAKELTTELSLKVMEGRERFERLVDERLAARRRELEARARELAQAARAEAGQKAEIRADAQRRIAAIAALDARVSAMAATVAQIAQTNRA